MGAQVERLRPELFDKLDNASKVLNGNGDQRGDGFISRADIFTVKAAHQHMSPL